MGGLLLLVGVPAIIIGILLLAVVFFTIRNSRKKRVVREAEVCLRKILDARLCLEIAYQPEHNALAFYVLSRRYVLTRRQGWVTRKTQPPQYLRELDAFAFDDIREALSRLGTRKDFEREHMYASGFWFVRPRQPVEA